MSRPIVAIPSYLILLAAMLSFSAPVPAERVERHGAVEIHYNAMPTTRLSPEVARSHDIQRSRLQGMVLVTVLHQGHPTPARVRGHAYTDGGERRDIRFRELRDGDAVSSIGTYRVDELERLRFELDVLPEVTDERYSLRFSERFFPD